MNRNKTDYKGEGGNAVALTLLGLAVAILAGVAVLYMIGKSKPQPMPKPAVEEVKEPEVVVNPREGWYVFEDVDYTFHVEFPQGWVVATGTLPTGEPVISISHGAGTTTPRVFGLDDVASHVSIYPQGAPGEKKLDKTKSSDVIIEVPQASAIDYLLKSGKPWATKADFEKKPESWGDEGFVFARVVVEEELFEYMRGEKQIAEFEFDAESGDTFTRSGFLDSKVRETQEEILRSIKFIDTASTTGEATANPFAEIETPQADTLVHSPLAVRGEVIGKWYFDEDISIRLETSGGEVLAEVPVTLGAWLSQETIPFEVSLVFGETTATSGNLVLGNLSKSNDSGEKANRIAIPVLFAQ